MTTSTRLIIILTVAVGAVMAVAGYLIVKQQEEMLLGQLAHLEVLSRRIVLTNQIHSADAPTLVAQHEPIAAAVAVCDPALLEAALRTHVIEGGELLMTRMSALEPSRSRRRATTGFGLGRWPTGAPTRSAWHPGAASHFPNGPTRSPRWRRCRR